MSNQDCHTEQLIKDRSKILFFTEGAMDASTQEIADFAGVNRTLVNYYFRSKKNLFAIVYSEIIEEMRNGYAAIYVSNVTFREKVEALIDYTSEFREGYPYLEIFKINEANKFNKTETIVQARSLEESKLFLAEIEEEMKKGTIPTYEPVNFLINIISLITFPIVMKPVFKEIFNISTEEHYQRIYNQRKEMAMTILFNK